MIIFTRRLCDLLVIDKQRFAYFSLLSPKVTRRSRSGRSRAEFLDRRGMACSPSGNPFTVGLTYDRAGIASAHTGPAGRRDVQDARGFVRVPVGADVGAVCEQEVRDIEMTVDDGQRCWTNRSLPSVPRSRNGAEFSVGASG